MRFSLLARLLVLLLILAVFPLPAAADTDDLGRATAPTNDVGDRGSSQYDPADEGGDVVEDREGVLPFRTVEPYAWGTAAVEAGLTSPDAGVAQGTCALSLYPEDPLEAVLQRGEHPDNPGEYDLHPYPYFRFAERMCDAQEEGTYGERIALDVAGHSGQGREQPYAVVTDPMTDEELAENERLQELLVDDPEAAAEEDYSDYRPALNFHGNIHGPEVEGADAILDLIEYLAEADANDPIIESDAGRSAEEIAELPTVGEVLDSYRLVLMPVMNPDGRVRGVRQSVEGLDPNRDTFTASQPESVGLKSLFMRYQPLVYLDIHGYVGGGTNPDTERHGLIEPTTGPHGRAYEYDLYVEQALGAGLAMEDEAVRRGLAGEIPYYQENAERTDIPLRDYADGWDDWPPIFTPMYAMLHGVVAAHTIEIPWGVNSGEQGPNSSAEWARATIDGTLWHSFTYGDGLLEAQAEWYRRGAAGEGTRNTPENMPPGFTDEFWADTDYRHAPCVKDDGASCWEEQDSTGWDNLTFPRAYVIPVGDGQIDDAAAHLVAQFVLDNDVDLTRTTEPVTIDGETYAVGSYLVDMHQGKRSMAYSMFDDGADLTADWQNMYASPAGWSIARLWGADVAELPEEDELPATAVVDEIGVVGGVDEDDDAVAYAFRADAEPGIQALTDLWDAGVELQRTADGTIMAGPADIETLQEVGETRHVTFAPVSALPDGRRELPELRVGTNATGRDQHQIQLHTLRDQLGFDTTYVTPGLLDSGQVTLDDFDALFVRSNGFDYEELGYERIAFEEWLADGRGVVAVGANPINSLVRAGGFFDNDAFEVSQSAGDGIIAVTNRDGSEVLPDRPADDASFTVSPTWLTVDESSDLTVEQTIASDPVIGGWWPDQDDAVDGTLTASGEAVGDDGDSRGRFVLMGADPLYRQHPKGQFGDVVDALLWATPGDETTDPLPLPDPAELESVVVDPDSAQLEPGDEQQFNATAFYDDGTQANVTEDAAWSSDDDAVVTVAADGLATAVGEGTATVTATFEDETANATVTVGDDDEVPPPGDPVDLVVTPEAPTIGVDGAVALSATAVYEDDSSVDVTGEAGWASDDTDVATVDDAGLVTGVAEGAAEVTASFAGLSDSALVTVDPEVEPGPVGLERISAEPGRVEVAIAASQHRFDDGEADAVVLARADEYPDALAGTTLAAEHGAPLLLTSSDQLLDNVADEIARALGDDGAVYLTGGTEALDDTVEQAVDGLGYDSTRLGGDTRFETAGLIADELGDRSQVLVTTGLDFPDALTAGAAASANDGVVLLSAGDDAHDVVDGYLDGFDGDVTAVGGPATRAYPDAEPVMGATRDETAVAVADAFFDEPAAFGISRRDDYPDALSGGAHLAAYGGPLLLSYTGDVPAETADWLQATDATGGFVYGGTAAIDEDTFDQIEDLAGFGDDNDDDEDNGGE